jgi:hypothetical protein
LCIYFTAILWYDINLEHKLYLKYVQSKFVGITDNTRNFIHTGYLTQKTSATFARVYAPGLYYK